MNLAWFLFYGRQLHMSRNEILNTSVGEMCDYINCFAISTGAAKPARNNRKMTFDECLAFR